jgi:hypothetical protein
MLQCGSSIRFTAKEIEDARNIGIDLRAVKSKADYSNAVIALIQILERERPSLLEKIAAALAKAANNKRRE